MNFNTNESLWASPGTKNHYKILRVNESGDVFSLKNEHVARFASVDSAFLSFERAGYNRGETVNGWTAFEAII